MPATLSGVVVLPRGSYTGQAERSLAIGGSLVSTTCYARHELNPEWHAHESTHFGYTFQGGPTTGPASTFYYEAGEDHRWIPDADVSKSILVELAPALVTESGCRPAQLRDFVHTDLQARLLLLQMQHELFVGDAESHLAISTLLWELVGHARRETHGPRPAWIQRLTEVLRDRWNEQPSLAELARDTGVHPVTISKGFRRHFGCTLGEHLRRLKIEHSVALIKDTKASLTDVAHRCGFADQSHFSRTFKRLTGFRPNEFRRL